MKRKRWGCLTKSYQLTTHALSGPSVFIHEKVRGHQPIGEPIRLGH